MKILVATGLYPPESGGPATYSKLLEERLPPLGVDVAMLPFSAVRHLPPVVRHAAYFAACLKLSRGCEIIYAQDVVSVGFPAAWAAFLSGKKFMVRVPGDYAWEQARQRFGVADELSEFQTRTYGWRTELLRSMQKFVVRRAAAVVVPSLYMKDIVSAWTDRSQIIKIYTSIPQPVAYDLPVQRPSGFLIVTVARLVPWKGVDRLIATVASHPDWKLVVVDDGPDRLKLESLAQELGAAQRITFVGRLPHPQAMGWVKAADVFVLNSTYEGLSHLLVEAMALGTPVVATAAGGNIELLENGGGLLVPVHDNEALKNAIASVQDNPNSAKERASAAQAQVSEQFNITLALNQLVALLKSL